MEVVKHTVCGGYLMRWGSPSAFFVLSNTFLVPIRLRDVGFISVVHGCLGCGDASISSEHLTLNLVSFVVLVVVGQR